MLIHTLLFYIFSFFLLASAFVVVTVRNPVHSVLFLIFAFFNSAGLFLLLGAEFISMLMVIVYVGAVAVLFLFVVMMLDIDVTKLREGFAKYFPIGFAVAVIMAAELITILKVKDQNSIFSIPAHPQNPALTNTENIGMLLYTDYLLPFQLAGFILLIAMIGAITLTLRTRPGVRKQNINKQVARKRADGVEIVKVQTGKGV